MGTIYQKTAQKLIVVKSFLKIFYLQKPSKPSMIKPLHKATEIPMIQFF